ncbi:MAG TPA: peptidoglycan-binding protein [Pyrinomonadaceae bacterium]|nr:peptidoglycan-binding protein [Pyrinomonadaceae bacterium]
MSVLKQGSSGPDVTALQNNLKQLGFDPNGVDGTFGPGTEKALIAFQKSKGLTPDGKAGPATMAALQARAAGGTETAAGSGGDASATASSGTAASGASVSNLNLAALTGLLPASVIAQIPETAEKFGITSDLRLAHFLAQCALESVEFTATVENLNYRAARLSQIFPKYFRNVDTNLYANNPAKIANRVYANRMGNGDEASGDGFRFRGRGYIQLTGRNNYTSFTNFIGEDCVTNPDLVATTYPLASAGFFFNSNKIWAVCDQGSSDATVLAVSTRVNGNPPHAVPERTKYFKKFFNALT